MQEYCSCESTVQTIVGGLMILFGVALTTGVLEDALR